MQMYIPVFLSHIKMINGFLIWFLDYVQYVLILPFSIGIYNFKYCKNESKVVFLYVLLGIVFELISRGLAYLNFTILCLCFTFTQF